MSTRAQILAEIAAQFPDNTSGAITPAKLRQVTEDLANSYNNSTDEPAQPLDSDLTALAGLSANGLVVRAGSGTAAVRTITGTANQVTVTNGDGAAGNPTLSLPQSIATTSAPEFARIGVGSAANATVPIYVPGYTDRSSVKIGSFEIQSYAINNCWLSDNINFDGTRFRYVGNGAGSMVYFEATGFHVRTAPSGGTAGATATTTKRLSCAFDGSVGIGGNIDANGGNLQIGVSGSLRFTTYGAGTLVTDSSGNVTASSDRRLKNVSGKFARGLDAIMQIQPKVFTWKPESGMNPDDVNVGFIAQDVQGAIPEAVGSMKTVDTEEDDGTGKKVKKSKREASEYLTLSDRPIIATLVNAVKELKVKNDELEARIKKLEAKK